MGAGERLVREGHHHRVGRRSRGCDRTDGAMVQDGQTVSSQILLKGSPAISNVKTCRVSAALEALYGESAAARAAEEELEVMLGADLVMKGQRPQLAVRRDEFATPMAPR